MDAISDSGLSVALPDSTPGWRLGLRRFEDSIVVLCLAAMVLLLVAGYVVMAAAGLSVLNVFVLGLVQRKRERAALRAIGMTPGQEQIVIVANAALLGAIVAGMAVLGGLGLTYLWSLGSPVFYGTKIEFGVLPVALRTGVEAVFVLVLAAAVYPVIHARRLETVEVLRSS